MSNNRLSDFIRSFNKEHPINDKVGYIGLSYGDVLNYCYDVYDTELKEIFFIPVIKCNNFNESKKCCNYLNKFGFCNFGHYFVDANKDTYKKIPDKIRIKLERFCKKFCHEIRENINKRHIVNQDNQPINSNHNLYSAMHFKNNSSQVLSNRDSDTVSEISENKPLPKQTEKCDKKVSENTDKITAEPKTTFKSAVSATTDNVDAIAIGTLLSHNSRGKVIIVNYDDVICDSQKMAALKGGYNNCYVVQDDEKMTVDNLIIPNFKDNSVIQSSHIYPAGRLIGFNNRGKIIPITFNNIQRDPNGYATTGLNIVHIHIVERGDEWCIN
jgi:hypothetical protein